MHNEILQVVEIVRRIPDCATQPFLCKCNDDNLYVVKGMPCVPKKQLMAEWISACLADSLGLSIPEFKIVYIDRSLTEFVPEWRRELYEGYAFATKYISGVAPITFTQAHSNVDVPAQKKIYLFDRWINNSDRTLSPIGGNVNIIFDYQNNRHYLIDHNLAFDHDELESDFEYHVYSAKHRSWVYDLVDKQEREDEISHARTMLSSAIEYIPEEWELDDTDENTAFLSFVENTLDRALSEEFWSNIK
ncbi:HipA family kinase [Yersinia pseudotuberculosis]|uniref:HipA family kinase n=1 Tax=Yersinia pseudotuberculosis TaxID=633 RepID=UPI0005DD8499|nr:HipA family kinase [Yersinia pseudotuberculosis]CFV22125.1 Uncharacterised protein [Yersinia pseudotuberculosis]